MGSSNKAKKNGKVIGIIAAVLVVAGTVAGLILGGVIKFGGGSGELVDLADGKIEEVCKKRGGIFDIQKMDAGIEGMTLTRATCSLGSSGRFLVSYYNEGLIGVLQKTVAKCKEVQAGGQTCGMSEEALNCTDKLSCVVAWYGAYGARYEVTTEKIKDTGTYFKGIMTTKTNINTEEEPIWVSESALVMAHKNVYVNVGLPSAEDKAEAEEILSELGLNQ